MSVLIVGLLAPLAVLGQQDGWCGTDRIMQEYYENNPSARQAENVAEDNMYAYKMQGGVVARSTKTVPVVVHVIHDNGVGNISKEQILDAIDVLNEDYNKSNHSSIRSQFQPFAANCEIEFKLAQKDPSGNCTDGIVRVNAPHLTYDSDNDDCKKGSLGGSDAWNPQRYMNIWVVNSIDNGGGSGVILGYAYLPWTGANWRSGILIINAAMGRIGTSSADGRTLTHEMGHALGLRHTFQDGCQAGNCDNTGDRCCDTPQASQATYACNWNQNTCGLSANSDYATDVEDQIENYMSYDACQDMFSLDQKDRMRYFLDGGGGSTSHLSVMSSSTNLGSNYTAAALSPILCKADFSTESTTVCAFQDVEFADESFNGVTSHNWTFSGANPSTSTDASPTVQYNAPGVYAVSLTAGDGSSTVDTTKNNYLTVLPGVGEDMPYSEDFSTITALPFSTKWFVQNPDSEEVWTIDASAGYGGGSCVTLLNSENDEGDVDALVSGPLNMNYYTNAVLTFKYAFAKKNSSNSDELKIYISEDCGRNWIYRGKVSAPTVSGTHSGSWVPASDAEWIEDSKQLPDAYLSPSTRIKFEMESGGGNNIYLDEINISAVLSVSETKRFDQSMSLFPNPTSGNSTLEFTLNEHKQISVQMIGLLGNQIEQLYSGDMPRGMHKMNLPTASLERGVYLVQLIADGERYTRRLVVN